MTQPRRGHNHSMADFSPSLPFGNCPACEVLKNAASDVMATVRDQAEELYQQARLTAIDPARIETLIQAHRALTEARWDNKGYTIYLEDAIVRALDSIAGALRADTTIGVGLHRLEVRS